jgi:hypothetical protein
MNTHQPIPPIDINSEMLQQIGSAYTEAESSRDDARQGIDTSINKHRICAALIEKASRFHKQDLKGFLSGIMSGSDVKRYMAIHQAAAKRPQGHDKRQLLLCGIIDQKQGADTDEASTATPPSAISMLGKVTTKLCAKIAKRPLCQWSDWEKDQARAIVNPLRPFMDELGE